MAKLNKKERAWVEKVQSVLNECPSARIGFYTIGDNTVFMFDSGKASDFCIASERVGAEFGEALHFPNPVESTAG